MGNQSYTGEDSVPAGGWLISRVCSGGTTCNLQIDMSALVSKSPSKSDTAGAARAAAAEGKSGESIDFEFEAQARGMQLLSCAWVSASVTVLLPHEKLVR